MHTHTFNVDLGNLEDEVVEALRASYENDLLEEALAAEQMLTQLRQQQQVRGFAIDGVGERTISAPPIFHTLARLNGESMDDPDYAEHQAKRFPEIRVNSGGTKEIHVGYNDAMDPTAVFTAAPSAPVPANGRKFHKSYG